MDSKIYFRIFHQRVRLLFWCALFLYCSTVVSAEKEQCGDIHQKFVRIKAIIQKHLPSEQVEEVLELLHELRTLYYKDGLLQEIWSKEWLLHMFQNLDEFSYLVKDATCFSCIYFDIDHFSHVNGTYGHTNGDHILGRIINRVSAVLKTTTRVKDTYFVRHGGDEFLILIRNLPQKRLRFLSARLLTEIYEYHKVFQGLEKLTESDIEIGKIYESNFVTLSAGMTHVDLAALAPIRSVVQLAKLQELLIEGADKLLYKSKKAGRGRLTDWLGQTFSLDDLSNSLKPLER